MFLAAKARLSRLRAQQRLRQVSHATPTVLQMEAAECGAACLAMILAYHGRWVPLEELRVLCGVSRNGSNALDLIRAGKSLGLEGRGLRREPERLADLALPAIIHWNFYHFVVLEGMADGLARINDPAGGRREVSLAELSQAFTGVVLEFKRGPAFVPCGRKPSLLGFFARQLQWTWAGVAMVALSSLVLVLPSLAIPVFAKVFIDEILLDRLGGWMPPLLLGMALTALLQAFVTRLQQMHLIRLQATLSTAMSSRFLWRALAQPVSFFSQRHAGEIANRVAANDGVAQLLSSELVTNAGSLASALAYVAIMLTFDWVQTLIGLTLVGLNVWITGALAERRDSLSRVAAVERGKLDAATTGTITMVETIKAGGLEGEAFTRWAGHHAKLIGAEQRLALYEGVAGVLPPLMSSLSATAILGLGGLAVMHGHMSIGMLVAFLSMMAAAQAPIAQLLNLAGRVQMIVGDVVRIRDVLDAPPRTVPAEPQSRPDIRGQVELSGVTFGYGPLAEPLLRDFSLVVEPGQRVALVGGSGSGKSTIGRLAAGLIDPWQGSVTIDGHPVNQLPASVRGSALAFVDQEVFLFEGSIRDNVTLWNPVTPATAVTRALKDAAIHDEIANRFGGAEGHLLEGGVNLSGGQRQRIEIARALVSDPAVLILDEATAALDPVTEVMVDDAIRRRGCTTLVIAHRLSTIRDADAIIVLDRGVAIERGTHGELLALGGAYGRLMAEE